MSDFLTSISVEQVTQVLIVVGVLALVWLVLRFILRLTAKIFALGCTAIVFLGLCIFIYRFAF